MPVLANSKYEAVARALLVDPEGIGWRAYKSVYRKSSRHAAETGFTRLMRNRDFAARLDELKAAAAEGAVVTRREVLEGLSVLARSNMLDYMRIGADGDPYVNLSDLTREQAAAIQEITTETYMDGHGNDAREVKKVKFKLYDKRAALVDLGRHYSLFKDAKDINVNVTLEHLVLESYGGKK
jgi:phage terminase small subunit